MAARLSKETTKIHLHLYADDLEYINDRFCRQGLRVIGRSEVVRAIVHAWVQHSQRKENAKPIPFDPDLTDLIT